MKFHFHEFWKDEWQAWLVVRDLPFTKMLAFINYEGHPSLWYIYLKCWTFFIPQAQDIWLNTAHFLLVFYCFYLLYFKLELGLVLKVFIAFSYFLFFEYGMVNRGYILVVLLSFLSVLAIKSGKTNRQGVFLFLLCQTEVFGAMIATVLLLYISHNKRWDYRSLFPVYALVGLGLIIFVITIYPRGNMSDFSRAYNPDWLSIRNFGFAFQGLLANTFGIGLIKNTSISGISSKGLFIAGAILASTVYLFAADKKIILLWLLAVAGFVLFSTVIYRGGVRQWGMLFVFFVCLLELRIKEIEPSKIKYWLSIALLLPAIGHNIKAVSKEIDLNFSNAKVASAFINEKIPSHIPIVSLNKFETVAAAGYSNRKFFELPSGQPFTYSKWLEKVYLPTQADLIQFGNLKKVNDLIIVAQAPLDTKRFPLLRLWRKFDDENFKSEDFYFYVLNLNRTVALNKSVLMQ